MSFLSPWVAAVAAAIVIPALLILYFLKLRRREELVSSTLLWKRAVQDLQVNAPFQRLRKNLLLFIQLLILAAAIFALARPIVKSSVADEARVVLLIDRSASMNTREEGNSQTRLDIAKEQASRLVRTFNQRTRGWRSFFNFSGAETGTQVMVIAFADRASVVAPFTTNTGELVDLIRAIEPSDGRSDLREAIDLAEAYLAPPARLTPEMEGMPNATPVSAEIPAKLVLISDGRIANLEKVAVRSGALEMLQIGKAVDNVGITAIRAQRNYEEPDEVDVFVNVRNFGASAVETDASVYVDGTMRTVRTLKLGAPPAVESPKDPNAPAPATPALSSEDGSAQSLSISLKLEKAALLEVRLARSDALAVDNSAFFVVPPPRYHRVLTITDGKNVFLDTVMAGLESGAQVAEFPFVTPEQFEAGEQGPYETEGQPTYDLFVFDKYIPQRKLPMGNVLFLGAIPTLPGLEKGEDLKNPPIIWWDETHPILRHVSLFFVYVSQAVSVKVPQQAEVLVEGPKGPMLFRYASEGRNYMVLTFPIEASNWWSKPSFPVFIYNTVRYLGGGAEGERGPTRPGDTLRVPFPPEKKELMLTRPDRKTEKVLADAFGFSYFGGTDKAGIYRVDAGLPGRDVFAVNVEDELESNIAPPQHTLKIADQSVKKLEMIKTATPEVWRWFMGAALLLVLFEWWVYNRRVMI